MEIKVFLSNNLKKNNWRFLQKNYFKLFYNSHGIFEVNDIGTCDKIIIYEDFEIELYHKYGKQIILINSDPSTLLVNPTLNYSKYKGNIIYKLNAFNGIYSSNLENGFLFKKNFILFKPRKPFDKIDIVTMATYRERNDYNNKIFFNRKNNLISLRQNLALHMYKKNICTIYGKNWPYIKTIDNYSNNPNWREDKINILKDSKHQFAIAFENFKINYWVTEKLWDCLECNILPIYYGSETIYEIFPKNSFIDYADFNKSQNDNENFENLYNYLINMDITEYNKRLKLCIDTYNKINKEYHDKVKVIFEPSCNKIIQIIKKNDIIIDYPDVKCFSNLKFDAIVCCHPKTASSFLVSMLNNNYIHMHSKAHLDNVIKKNNPILNNINFNDLLLNTNIIFDIYRDPLDMCISYFFHLLDCYNHCIYSEISDFCQIKNSKENILVNCEIEFLIKFFKERVLYKKITNIGDHKCGIFNWNVEINELKKIKTDYGNFLYCNKNNIKYIILDFKNCNNWQNQLNSFFGDVFKKGSNYNLKKDILVKNLYEKFKKEFYFTEDEEKYFSNYFKKYKLLNDLLK